MSFQTNRPSPVAIVNGLIGNTSLSNGGVNLNAEDLSPIYNTFLGYSFAQGQSAVAGVERLIGRVTRPGILQFLAGVFIGTDIQTVRFRVFINSQLFIDTQSQHADVALLKGNMFIGGPISGATVNNITPLDIPFQTLDFFVTTPFTDAQAMVEYRGAWVPTAY